ncbi:probable DIP5-glutamate and aspartate permease [Serendipita indica DSM 11827]|uniref:Probable DIP5-glutamate and aspartate permease n=1 Tax=Serendipita indica (strain DSM 11827) TaxID=1109443 RepID=G4TEC1_SERID|nr:probable DIP5-glutamate and aspartate permease [Serendipita indica DSM 11827]
MNPTATGYMDNGGSDEMDDESVVVHQVAPKDYAGREEERKKRTLRRELNSYQVTMITLGGTLGTGLLVASGTALSQGGPLGLLLAYIFLGFVAYCMMTSLCELSSYLPHKKGFIGLISRYVHPAIGFGLGWTYLCRFIFVPPSHINTAAIVMSYINDTTDRPSINPVPSAAWRVIFIVGVNLLAIRGFGRLEFWLSSFKVVALIVLILFGLVVDLGGVRLKSGNFERIGFRYWQPPAGPMGHGVRGNVPDPNPTQTFLGFWATLVRVLFAYEGMELIGVVVGEAANPRVSVPKAIKQTYRLVITLYITTVFIIGLICASNDDTFTGRRQSRGQISPFIIAANNLSARALVPVINSTIIMFALSAATSNIYTGSRLLYGLALDGQAPKILTKLAVGGRPLLALAACSAWCFLSYLGQNDGKANHAFDFFVDVSTTAGSLSWICIFWAHIRFRQALQAQNQPLSTLKYLAPLHPYGTWFSLIVTVIFAIFKGYESFVKRHVGGLIAAYVLFPWFFALVGFWKYFKHGTFVPLDKINLQEGKREIDLEEEDYFMRKAGQPPQSWWKRVLN